MRTYRRKLRFFRPPAAALLAVSAISLAAALSSAAPPAAAGTLHMHNGGDPASLDPHKVSGDWENRIVGDLFEGLVTEDRQASPIPGMALRWEISADGLTYTFHLRDAKWSDGEAVTAHDFVFAYRRLMDPKTAANYAYLQYPIRNAEAVNGGDAPVEQLGVAALDDRTLRIELENPTPYFLGALTHYTAYPVPRHALARHGDEWVKPENIVSNGPYKAVEWVPGSHVRAVKNDLHHDAANIDIGEVIYYVLEDESAALRRYEAGEFDILTEFPTDHIERLLDERPDELFVAPFQGLYYYVFNHNTPQLSDRRVREALSMAVNRPVITDKILGNGALPAYSWVPPGMDNYGVPYSAAWQDMPYSMRVARAKQLMAEAGHSADNPLRLTLRYNTNENHKRVAIAVSGMWKALGVETELVNTEVKVHYDDLQRNTGFDIARAGWLADYNDPDNFLNLLRSDVDYNYGRWNNAEFDALMERAKTEVDLSKRAGILYRGEQLAIDDSAALPIYYYVSRNIVSKKIKGFEDNVRDIHRTRWLTKTD